MHQQNTSLFIPPLWAIVVYVVVSHLQEFGLISNASRVISLYVLLIVMMCIAKSEQCNKYIHDWCKKYLQFHLTFTNTKYRSHDRGFPTSKG